MKLNPLVQRSLLLCLVLKYIDGLGFTSLQASGIMIASEDFAVSTELTTIDRVMNRIECGAHFLVVKEDPSMTSVNGFSVYEHTCKLGTVVFPVEEVEENGILVSGISETFWCCFSRSKISLNLIYIYICWGYKTYINVL